jgi:hypothetical protein
MATIVDKNRDFTPPGLRTAEAGRGTAFAAGRAAEDPQPMRRDDAHPVRG